jgi:hemerythrin superfamily protein
MSEQSSVHSWEILRCVVADQDAFRTRLADLAAPELRFEERQEKLNALLPAFTAHIRAEEEVLLSRALEFDVARVTAMAALEEHEITENLFEKAKQSAHPEQLQARLKVLTDLVVQHALRSEKELYPMLRSQLSVAEREEMGMRYREARERNELAPVFQMPVREGLLESQTGRIGYVIAWFLGIPVWVLLLVFMVRGH